MEREEEEKKLFLKNEIEYHGGELEQIEINVLLECTKMAFFCGDECGGYFSLI